MNCVIKIRIHLIFSIFYYYFPSGILPEGFNYFVMYLHCPNMALNNANFRLQTHKRLDRLFPLFNREYEPMKAHKRISYFWFIIPFVVLCLFLLLIVC